MSLSDSLMPDRTEGQTQAPALAAAREQAAPDQAMQDLFSRNDVALNAEFGRMYAEGGADAREAVARAVATEGPAAFDRLKAEPEAFGTVVGDRTRAEMLGGTAEALNYWQARHTAQQEGRDLTVPGYGPGSASQGVATREVRDVELDRATVEQAVQTIREQIRDTPVGRDNLDAAAGALLNLKGDGPNRAMAMLREGDLATWADQLNDPQSVSALEGYNGTTRDGFYRSLANRLNGEQLGRFGAATSGAAHADTTMGRIGEAGRAVIARGVMGIQTQEKQGAEGQAFAHAVISQASPEARQAFVQQTLQHVTRDQDSAVMTSEVIASLSDTPERIQAALGRAAPAQLEALVSSGILRTLSVPEGGPEGTSQASRVTFDTTPVQRLLGAIGATTDIGLRARVFVAADDALERANGLRSTPLADGTAPIPAGLIMRSGMNELIGTQTNDFVDALRTNGDSGGQVLTRYIGNVVAGGSEQFVEQDIDRLLRGDGLDGSEPVRFAESRPAVGGGTEYPNAGRLAFYRGAVESAFENRAEYQRAMTSMVAGVAATVANKATGSDLPGNGIEMAGDAAAENIVERTRGTYLGLRERAVPEGVNIDVEQGASGYYRNVLDRVTGDRTDDVAQ